MVEIYNMARRAEKEGKWSEAARLWRSYGSIEDAEACELIVQSTNDGDRFRQRVKNELGDEPDKNLNAHGWVKWYDGMGIIYNEMFNKK